MRRIIAATAIMLTLLAVNAYAIETPYIDGKTGEWVIAEISSQEDAIDITEAPPIEDVSVALDEVDAIGNRLTYLGEFKLTYYDSCSKCNGKWGPIDGFGNPLEWGCVAVDPHVIPLRTKLVIDGYDAVFEARDTGSGVDGRHIDVFVPVSHAEALKMPHGERRMVWRYETN